MENDDGPFVLYLSNIVFSSSNFVCGVRGGGGGWETELFLRGGGQKSQGSTPLVI